MNETRALARAGARGGVVTVVAQVVSISIRIVGLVILARLLAPSIFGLAAIAVSISSFASAIIFLGLPMATAQAKSLSNKAQSFLFWINSILGMVTAVVMLVLAPALARLYDNQEISVLVQWLALVPLLSGIQSQFRLRLVRKLKFNALAISEVVAQATSTTVAICLALSGFGIEALVAQGVIMSAVQLLFVLAVSRWIPGRPGDWAREVRPILEVGLRIFGSNVLRDGSRSALIPIMGLSFSPNLLGNYDRAQQLSIVPITATVDNLQRVVVPILSRLRDDKEQVEAFYRRGQLVILYSTGALFSYLAATSPIFVVTLLGDDWRAAGTVLQVLCIGAIFRSLGHASQWLFIACGATGASLRLSLIAQPTILLISLSGIPWGIVGVAVANSLGWLFYWPVSAVVATSAAGLPKKAILYDGLRGILLFCVPIGLVSLGITLVPWSTLYVLTSSLLGFIVVAVLLAWIIPQVRRDILSIVSAMRMAYR
ncbi:lipopolysaccharide biosynthesis protein [Rhodococcus sp. IEGM 1330]|uniref:lipopolysaccharide biosynthesis protein n=1 Tax=Rhodococcus sp. IEGM 1330 TaxID=3082225 RepID=UPI002955B24E|nr:lipopolysaccharide biosynthesis protein [Rhodococcus sp. IEGM 1330]MDV8023653.1 lipopolysaccharide biosynthesis protein [Rhodococcus sp. IEGM 1330]